MLTDACFLSLFNTAAGIYWWFFYSNFSLYLTFYETSFSSAWTTISYALTSLPEFTQFVKQSRAQKTAFISCHWRFRTQPALHIGSVSCRTQMHVLAVLVRPLPSSHSIASVSIPSLPARRSLQESDHDPGRWYLSLFSTGILHLFGEAWWRP